MPRIRALCVSLLLLVAGLLAVPAPALAATADCPAGYICLWSNVDYTGTRWQQTAGAVWQSPHGCIGLPSWITNSASSMFTNAGPVSWDSFVYDNYPRVGTFFRLEFSLSARFNGPRAYMDNKASSVCVSEPF